MAEIKILWADDEIDLLKPHILFLQEKGILITTTNNGRGAIDWVSKDQFDIVFLDEQMPGVSGLEALAEIKRLFPSLPVVMITKSEEEFIMEEAIGSKITDYLIKPVNPNQILLSIKKIIDKKRLISQKTTSTYQMDFGRIGIEISQSSDFEDWVSVYRKLVYWELELARTQDHSMDEILKMQKEDANKSFARFVRQNYEDWFKKDFKDRPLLSPDLFRHRILPASESSEHTFFILIDNLRYDQWKILEPSIQDLFTVEKEEIFCSILPTATQYARNAMFAGLMPADIASLHKEFWLNDEEDGGKNLHEEELLNRQLSRLGKDIRFRYEKVTNSRSGKKLAESATNLLNYPMSVIVYNFVDMLSHASTDSEMIRELAGDEAAYRSLTLTWFKHSYLFDLLSFAAQKKVKVILSTDHGTIRVDNPVKVIGDRNTTTNLRYKSGKNLNYPAREVFEILKPETARLPKSNVSTSYVFCQNNDFFAYPNNYNHFVNYYRNTFQHGGISLEEMLIPFVVLSPKKG